MNKKINQKSIREYVKNGEAANQCLICLEDDHNVLEEHHIFSRAASERTELLCKNCHAPITHEQNKVPPKSRSKNASHLEKVAYQLISIGALLREIGIQLIKLGHELIYNVQKCSPSLYS